MSTWLEEMKSKTAEKGQAISSEEKERLNNFIDKLVSDVRTKEAIFQELERKILKLNKSSHLQTAIIKYSP